MPDLLRKRHHYRPAFHLRHFAGADGRLWVHHRFGGARPQPAAPQAVGFETFLYAPGEGTEAPRSDVFERWLSDAVDGPAAGPIARVAAGGEPSDARERLAIARFIAAQDLRTPAMRDLLVNVFQQGLEAEWPDVVARSLAALGMNVDAESVSTAAEIYAPRVTNAAWLDFMRGNLNRVAYRLACSPWTVLTAPRRYDWLTSDFGIVKFVGGFAQPAPWRPGWAENADHWVVPVSSRVALAIAPNVAPARAEARPAWLKAVNQRLALDARGFVAARHPAYFVQGWWHSA